MVDNDRVSDVVQTNLDLIEDETLVAAPEKTDIDQVIDDFQSLEFHDVSEDDEDDVVTKDVSDESVVDVKTSAECLEYLKHITNKFISVGMEPPIEISNLEDRIRQFPQVQTMITEFFANND